MRDGAKAIHQNNFVSWSWMDLNHRPILRVRRTFCQTELQPRVLKTLYTFQRHGLTEIIENKFKSLQLSSL